MAESQQTKFIIIPKGFTSRQRELIGEEIIMKIRRRTGQGLDVNNEPFAAYSKFYDKTGTVNLKVSNEMLSELEVIGHGDGYIIIGFGSSEANDKAAYIQQPRGKKVGKQPIRTFVGISQRDLNIILDRYRQNDV